MHKRYLLMVGAVLLSIFSFGTVIAEEPGETMCIPMGSITIAPPHQVESKRTPVDFPHAIHFNYTCKTCHHKWDQETPVISCQTAGCHDITAAPKKAGSAKIDSGLSGRYYKAAYHGNCIGCHKKIKQHNKAIEDSYRSVSEPIQKSGPTGCTECHPKE